MPTTASRLPSPLKDGDRLSTSEFMRRWDAMPELKHAELIDGVVHIASPVLKVHGSFHFRVAWWIGHYIAATIGCEALTDTTWQMSPDNVPQPDLAVGILPEYGGQSGLAGGYATGAPELIVEVSVSTLAKDAGAKLRLYERSGVREYLTVQPEKRRLVWRELANGAYREIVAGPDGCIRSRILPGLWLNLKALWENNLPALAAAVQQGVASPEHAAFVRDLKRQKQPPQSS